ncbi:MAG: hypothetical protein ACYS4W_03435, partial [Planctomycetota bacterium]
MRRLPMVVLVVQALMCLCGCKKKAEEAPGAKPEPALTKPVAVEKAEPTEPDIGRGLVCWWKFDETSGTTAANSSGSGRAGTLQGGLSFDSNSVTGRVGKALRFEGGDKYIQIDDYKGILGTKPRTTAAWIKTRSDNGQILSWGRDEGGGM